MKNLLGALWILMAWPVVAISAEKSFEFFEPLSPPRSFAMLARGREWLAPANSRASIQMAIEDGLEWIAVDVRLSSDGQHVLFHDANLDGRTSGHGPLDQHSLAELQQLDAGSWFARRYSSLKLLSLDDCLAQAKGKINLCLNCLAVDPHTLVKQIQRAGMEKQVLASGAAETLTRVRAVSAGKIAVMFGWSPTDGFGPWLESTRPAVVEIAAGQVTPEVCREFHTRGVRVLANLPASSEHATLFFQAADKALAAGADVLRTDVPEEVVAHVLAQQLKSRKTRMTCHRGASRYAPENTLPAFDKAYLLHADFVEFDVRPSLDGKFFLLHDGQLNRTTNATGPIRDSASSLIESLDAGSWFGKPFAGTRVPSLEAFLAAAPAGPSLYFDAKDIPPEALAAAVAARQLTERTVVYQSAEYLTRLKQIEPRLRALPPAKSEADVTRLAESLKPYGVDTPWMSLSQKYIEHCHAHGIQVFSDAPPFVDVKSYRRAIEWGIDVIQTDYPLHFWRAMELVAVERATP